MSHAAHIFCEPMGKIYEWWLSMADVGLSIILCFEFFFINLWLLLVCDWLFSRVTALWFWNRDNNRMWNLYSEAIIKASFFRLHTLFTCFVNVVGGKCWLEEYDWRCWKEKHDLYGGQYEGIPVSCDSDCSQEVTH